MISSVKKIWIIFLITLIGALLWFVVIPYVKSLMEETLAKRINIESYSEHRMPMHIGIKGNTLEVTLAVSDSEKMAGLGGQRFIDDNSAMLFVFEKPGYPAIWMKDMFFAIDVVWLDSEFRIIDIKSDLSPATYPKSFEPGLPASYVLETNAGYLASHGIILGDSLYLVDDEKI